MLKPTKLHSQIFQTIRKQIIDTIPSPELHLMIGVVNTLFKHRVSEFEEVSFNSTKTYSIPWETTCGTSAFAGSYYKILLDKVDVLCTNYRIVV